MLMPFSPKFFLLLKYKTHLIFRLVFGDRSVCMFQMLFLYWQLYLFSRDEGETLDLLIREDMRGFPFEDHEIVKVWCQEF